MTAMSRHREFNFPERTPQPAPLTKIERKASIINTAVVLIIGVVALLVCANTRTGVVFVVAFAVGMLALIGGIISGISLLARR
jgi:uncharacterized membrane protein HdeD (DUF308 family)